MPVLHEFDKTVSRLLEEVTGHVLGGDVEIVVHKIFEITFQRIVDKFQGHIGMKLGKSAADLGQEHGREIGQGADADGLSAFFFQLPAALQHTVGGADHLLRFLVEILSRSCQRDALVVAVKQLEAQIFFQQIHLLDQSGPGDEQLVRGRGEAAGFGDDDEGI